MAKKKTKIKWEQCPKCGGRWGKSTTGLKCQKCGYDYGSQRLSPQATRTLSGQVTPHLEEEEPEVYDVEHRHCRYDHGMKFDD